VTVYKAICGECGEEIEDLTTTIKGGKRWICDRCTAWINSPKTPEEAWQRFVDTYGRDEADRLIEAAEHWFTHPLPAQKSIHPPLLSKKVEGT